MANLKIREEKFICTKYDMIYISNVIFINALKTNLHRVHKNKDFQIPNNMNDFRSFLSRTNYYQNFIQNFSQITNSNNLLLENITPYQWKKSRQQVFD